MTTIRFADDVAADYDRIVDRHSRDDAGSGLDRLADIRSAIAVLASNPLIGRRLPSGLRELIIGRCTRGYIALYRYADALDQVTIVGIGAQKESGYHRP